MDSEVPFIDFHSHLKGAPGKGILRVISLFPGQVQEMDGLPPLFTTGIHPWHSGDEAFSEDFFHEMAGIPNFIGIGEIGLDRMTGPGVERQISFFTLQAEMAEKLNKPVTIHCVRAWEEIIHLKKKIHPRQPWTIHGYRGGPDKAERLVSEGFYLSFGAAIMRQDAPLRESLRVCPADRLFLETDEEHVPITSLYTEAALIRGISVQELKMYIAGNFKRIYGIS
jgi:TatD DNase family protein